MQLRLIKESIPAILEDISKEMESAQEECKSLGTAISNASDRRNLYMTMYSAAMESVKAYLSGRTKLKESTKSLLAEQHEAFGKFAKNILATRLANITKISVGGRVEATFEDGSSEFGIQQRMVFKTSARNMRGIIRNMRHCDSLRHIPAHPGITKNNDSPVYGHP